MFFNLTPTTGQPLYLQLMQQIRHAAETGALRDGDQLPGIRTLAEELVVSPNTIAKAYSELEHEGLLELRQGSGLDEPFGGLDPLVRDQLIESLLERATESTVFLSSHDLAEIESFASHVGYLESGRLLFSEEMNALNSRFREVEVTLESERALP